MGKGAVCCLLLSAPPRRRPGANRGTRRAKHQCPPNWIPAFAGMVGGANSGMTCLDILSDRGVFGALGAGRVFPWPSTSLRLNGGLGMGRAWRPSPFALSEVEVQAPTSRKQPRPHAANRFNISQLSPVLEGTMPVWGRGQPVACCFPRHPGGGRGPVAGRVRQFVHARPAGFRPSLRWYVGFVSIAAGLGWVSPAGSVLPSPDWDGVSLGLRLRSG
ncbi:hypothetical protein QE360_000600 [Sphingomonas sp. SORGH_AS789]|nr:hypothetical protein [Sphingomonas sp. SORGH_AS_0789]MDR6149009.1 hypothetical protein [Sphingomonas sp. SORGH_AS_0742]